MDRANLSGEVVIVGASLAGSACAISLASRNVPVVLLDRATFPRRKACGEGLSYLAKDLLAKIGIAEDVLLISGQKLYGYRLALPDRKGYSRQHCIVGTDNAHALGVSRARLDTAVIERLKQFESASVLCGQSVKEIARHRNRWEVVTEYSRITASYTVLATGANPQGVAHQLIAETRPPSARVGLTWLGHIQSTLHEVTIMPFVDGELYITPIGAGFVNVSVVGTREFVQKLRNPPQLRQIIREAIALEITLSGQTLGAAHFCAARRSLDPQLYLVGDAYESFDPRCGFGMTHALLSGIAAAESIFSALRSKKAKVEAQQRYEAQHEEIAKSIRRYSRAVQTFITAYRRYPQGVARAQSILGPITLKLLDHLAPCALTEAISV